MVQVRKGFVLKNSNELWIVISNKEITDREKATNSQLFIVEKGWLEGFFFLQWHLKSSFL